MGEFVRLEVDEASRVGTIRLDRPPVNALNAQIQDELLAAAEEAGRDERVGAVVLWGGDKVFAAGADIKEMQHKSYPGTYLEDFITALDRVAARRKPIIAAVSGVAVLLLAYLMPSLRSMFNAGSAVALAVFTGIAGAASLAAGLRTRSFVLGCLTFAALCLGLTGLFLLRSAWLTEAFSAVLSALSLFTPFEDFVNNSFSIPAVVYYLTVTAVFLFFTAQDIEKRRWN